ncbi:DUF5677 domain-containing protein, partial [Thermodesulfobacteriota bacterium]
NKVLSQRELIGINEQFEELFHRGKRKREPKWYEPLRMSSIWRLAKAVDCENEYQIVYSEASDVVHSNTYRHHISFASGNNVFLEPIRSLEKIVDLSSLISTRVLKTYRVILQEYRPSEVSNFNHKYKEHWRPRFDEMNRLRIKTVPELTEI